MYSIKVFDRDGEDETEFLQEYFGVTLTHRTQDGVDREIVRLKELMSMEGEFPDIIQRFCVFQSGVAVSDEVVVLNPTGDANPPSQS